MNRRQRNSRGQVIPPRGSQAPVSGHRVVRAFPHDPDAFTQGLQFQDGVLFEGTGLYGASSVRRVDLETGRVLALRRLPHGLFGEGIAVLDERIVQLTWQSEVGVIWHRETLAPLGQFSYEGEGWGLATDGRSLVMSDGTSTLRFLDAETFTERRRVTVTDGGEPIFDLNALAFVRGELLANVWLTDYVARIDPETGTVSGWIDLSTLAARSRRSPEAVTNGIAFDAEKGRHFVTGKNWSELFEIALVEE